MLNNAPARVSIVVPTRRRPELLREALASIRALESPQLSLEILVCDNGDGEGAHAAGEFGAIYLRVDRPRAAAARNDGMLAATGEFIAFLDDDDVWIPGHLLPKIELLQQNPDFGGVVGQTVTTDEFRIPTSEPWPAVCPQDGDLFQAFFNQYPQIGSTVVRRSVLDTVGLFDERESADGDEDWDWQMRLALAHKVGFVPVPGVLFRQRSSGSFDDLQWQRLFVTRRVMFRTMARAWRRLPSPRECFRASQKHHWDYYLYFVDSAIHHLAEGDRRAAWQSTTRAFLASPVHVALGLVRNPPLRQLLGALFLGRPAPQPSAQPNYQPTYQPSPYTSVGTPAANGPVVVATTDRAAAADAGMLAAYPAASSGTWAEREVAR
jgi:glycosyltransferase involved in cell wall biosynthesis